MFLPAPAAAEETPPHKSVDDTDGSWLTSSQLQGFYLTALTKCGSYQKKVGISIEVEHG